MWINMNHFKNLYVKKESGENIWIMGQINHTKINKSCEEAKLEQIHLCKKKKDMKMNESFEVNHLKGLFKTPSVKKESFENIWIWVILWNIQCKFHVILDIIYSIKRLSKSWSMERRAFYTPFLIIRFELMHVRNFSSCYEHGNRVGERKWFKRRLISILRQIKSR